MLFTCCVYLKFSNKFKNYYSDNTLEVFDKMKDIAYNSTGNNVSLFLIHGVEEFINSLGTGKDREFKAFLAAIKGNKNIRIVFSDSVNKIKLYEYEDFYRACVQPINAIWVGSGITDQYTIKSSTYTKETRAAIPGDFGYNVDRGNAIYAKLLDFFTEE